MLVRQGIVGACQVSKGQQVDDSGVHPCGARRKLLVAIQSCAYRVS